jgi:outer membrane protein assembly factor BamB
MRKITLLCAFCIIAIFAAYAGTEPKWKATFGKELNWMKVTDVGTLVVATDDGLYGINSEDGSIVWKNEALKKLVVEAYEPLPETPFIIITPEAKPAKQSAFAGIMGSFNKGSVVIINAQDGKVACDTKALGMDRLSAQYSLPDLNAIIFQGSSNKGKQLTLFYDFNTNTKIWEQEYILGKKDASFLPPAVIDKNTIIWTGTSGYSIIDAQTGALKYRTEIKFKDIAAPKMVFNKDRSVVYFVNKKFGNAYKISDGSKLWKEEIDMDDPASHVFTDERGIYIAVKNHINLYDYNTGEPKWGKDGIKLYDPLLDYVFTDKGLGIQMVDKDDYSVNLLNYETGKPLIKKAVKLKASAKDLRMVTKGLLYRTEKELNILDVETGAPSFDKSIKFKEPVLAIDKGDKTYIFSGPQYYDFNNKTCTYTNKSIVNKFEGKEIPSKIELRPQGILLKSDQNLTMFDFEGNTLYHAYYKAPGLSMVAKLALGAMSVAAAGVAAQSAAASGYEKGLNGNQHTDNSLQNGRNADAMGGIASAGFKAMGKRFNASKEADNFVTMLTKLDDGVGVVKLNKDTGAKENEVVFKEKEPVYELDDIGGMLYFKSKKTELSGFKF